MANSRAIWGRFSSGAHTRQGADHCDTYQQLRLPSLTPACVCTPAATTCCTCAAQRPRLTRKGTRPWLGHSWPCLAGAGARPPLWPAAFATTGPVPAERQAVSALVAQPDRVQRLPSCRHRRVQLVSRAAFALTWAEGGKKRRQPALSWHGLTLPKLWQRNSVSESPPHINDEPSGHWVPMAVAMSGIRELSVNAKLCVPPLHHCPNLCQTASAYEPVSRATSWALVPPLGRPTLMSSARSSTALSACRRA
jgi:hypothetical protein